MIHLSFLTSDSVEIALAKRYWAIDDMGKFKENVVALLPFREIAIAAHLTAFMRTIVQATDQNQKCPKCGNFEKVTNRSQVKRKPQIMRFRCNTCRANEQADARAQETQSAIELWEHIKAVSPTRKAMRTNFATLPSDTALMLIALDRAIDPRLVRGSFRQTDCAALAPMYVNRFIQALRDARAIVDHPELADSDAYEIEAEQLCYYPSRVVYKLVPDPVLSNEAALELLKANEFPGCVALRNLWLDYATADCMAYFINQCEFHGMPTDQALSDEFYSAVRVALQKYSVENMWSVIWRIVRDALALASRSYSNRHKAAATLPGKLRRHLDKLKRGDAPAFRKWDRPKWQPAGTLGQVFTELFGIDETTPGVEVMTIFSDPVASEDVLALQGENLHFSANRLFSAALAHDMAANTLICLTSALKEGLELNDAISHVFVELPVLDEPF